MNEFDSLIESPDIEAEMCALGSCFLGGMETAQRMLSPESFYAPYHAETFTLLTEIYKRGLEIDLVTFKNFARERVNAVGGIEYMIQLLESVATAANTASYCEIVKINHLRREASRRAQEFAKEAKTLTPEEIHHKHGKMLEGLSGFRQRSIRADEIDLDEEDHPGTKTPWPDLNRAIEDCGGLPRGQVTVIAATKKGGKTATMTQFAWNTLRRIANGADGVRGRRIAYVTVTDLGSKAIKKRIVRQVTGLVRKPVLNVGPTQDELRAMDDWNAIATANEWMRLKFFDAQADGSADIREVGAWLHAENNIEPFEEVYLDYFQQFRAGERDRVRDLERVAQVTASIAANMPETAVIIGSQISKEKMTRYSQELEDVAGVVLRIERSEDDPRTGYAEVAYNRFGPACSFALNWNPMTLKYTCNQGERN